MTRRPAADVALARRLLAFEGAGAAAAVRVYARLAARLEPLIGVAGMRALLARSAKLAAGEHPRFAVLAFETTASGPACEQQLQACFEGGEPEELIAAAAALYATLLGLLTSFIGEHLVGQVVRSAFPAVESEKEKES